MTWVMAIKTVTVYSDGVREILFSCELSVSFLFWQKRDPPDFCHLPEYALMVLILLT